MTLIRNTVLVAALMLVSNSLLGADEYNALDKTQTTNLKVAAKIGAADGHHRMLMPAVIYQETKAGDDKNHKTFIGIGQLGFGAIKEVLQEFPEVSKNCGGISSSSNVHKIKNAVQNNDQCGIAVASKYMAVIRDKYGITTEERQVIAYQRGPAAGKKLKSTPYSASVMRHKRKLTYLME